MPGEDKVENLDFNVNASGKSDVWLVFDPTDINYAAWTGPSGAALHLDGGLGRYGHFAVVPRGTMLFESRNLAHAPSSLTPEQVAALSCSVNTNGNGGSAARPTARSGEGSTVPYCGVPTAIKIASNLNFGDTGAINMTFGVTGRQTAQNQQLPTVPFKIVATQAGISPTASNF